MDLCIEPLEAVSHDRHSFDCGVSELNIFFKQHANQNQLKNLSKTYVAVTKPSSGKNKLVYGFYTLSAGQIHFDQLPVAIKSKLPKYPVPIVRLGRLAVDVNYRGVGIGALLLHSAFRQVLAVASKIGLFALVVDAKNEKAVSFYRSYGFIQLQDVTQTLYLPISTLEAACE